MPNFFRGKSIFLIFLILFAFSTSEAFATSSRRVETTCPVCKTVFSASELMSTNNFGGYDSDLCPHARGSSPLHIRIWGCPECHYSGFSDDFKKKFTASQQEELKQWLRENFKVFKLKEDKVYNTFSAARRYEIAAELAIKNAAPALEIARLFMNAAWCTRNIGILVESKDSPEETGLGPEYCPTLFKVLNETKVEPSRNNAENFLRILEKISENFAALKIPEAELAASYLNLGWLMRSTGENEKAEVWLKKAIESDSPHKKIIEAVQASMAREKSYQLKAISWFEKALAKTGDNAASLEETMIMLAESYRLTGNADKAVSSYLKLFAQPDVSPFVFDLARASFARMGRLQEFPEEKAAAVEERKIIAALQALESLQQPNQVARYLSASTRRDLIFPKLKEFLASENSRLAEAALKAMSDDSPESVALQIELFARGVNRETILRNFANLNTSIPSAPLLKVFAESEAQNLPDYLMARLAAIQEPQVEEALLARAEQAFTSETVKQLSENKPEVYAEEKFYRHLIQSLGSADSLRPLPVLQCIVDNAIVDGYNFGNTLLSEAGSAIEVITNCYFGFSIVTTRQREPQFDRPDKDYGEHPFKIAKANLHNWLEKNSNRPYREIVLEGFAKAGYRVLPESDPACLNELIEGLSDRFEAVRYHSYRELERRTGISYRPLTGRNPEAYPIDFKEIIWFYQNWLDQNEKTLIYNPTTKKFEIKQPK